MHVHLRATLALSALAATSAFARPAAAAPPAWTALPAGAFTTPPKSAPASIGAGERVAGFWAVIPRHSGSRPFAMMATSAESAKALRNGEAMSPDGGGRVCFSTRDRSTDEELDERAWDNGMSGTERVWPKTADNPRGGVTAVHTERLVTSGEGATLEIVDLWVDPATLGSRLITKTSVPFKLVGSALGGVKVYAARHDNAGAKQVHWLVHRPLPTHSLPLNTSLSAWRPGAVDQSNECDHIHVTTETGHGHAESAIVQATVLLESRTPKPAAAPSQKSQAKERPLTLVRKLLGGPSRVVEAAPRDEPEARARQMDISVSASMTTRDKEPVLSVSFGWSSRDKVVRGVALDEHE
jgi:hypothetical protein